MERTASLAALAWLLAANGAEAQSPSTKQPRVSPAPREFRAAWVATVDNIDWPSRAGLPVAKQKEELDALLDSAASLRLNAIVFQVRPSCDAFYRSKLEPWSEWLTGIQGQAPSPPWDPLAHAVAGAHDRGLELHAWFNPYRARHKSARSKAAPTHVTERASWHVRHGKQLWLDPGNEQAREHSLDVILDVVTRYDVDGVHLDDYFYPYPLKGTVFPDAISYGRYRAKGGRLGRDDWRRDNVNRLIRAIHREVHRIKPWVKFGISPFGIARRGEPKGIVAGIDQFDELYADPVAWLREGHCDYLAPQLYWPIDSKGQSFPLLLRFWVGHNRSGRSHVWPGLYTGRIGREKNGYTPAEVLRQIDRTRRLGSRAGHIHFSMRTLQRNTQKIATRLRSGPYRTRALIPRMPWLDRSAPRAPRAELEAQRKAVLLRWQAADDEDAFWHTVYVRAGGRWQLADLEPVTQADYSVSRSVLRKARIDALATSTVDRAGNESQRITLPIPAIR